MQVETESDRIHIRGAPDHPITRGFVCGRIRRHVGRLRDPERVTTPLLRREGKWQETDWQTALDLAAEKLSAAMQEDGPASVVYQMSGGSLGLRKKLVGHFFSSLGPVTTLRGGVCDECGVAAQEQDFGMAAGHDFTDLGNSQAVVLWGKNPAATGVHLIPFLQERRRASVPIVLIEVVATETAAFVDRLVSVAPGGDGFLALSVLRLLLDSDRLDARAIARCENFVPFRDWLAGSEMQVASLARQAGVAMADVEFLAELYAQPGPVATHLGWGLQRRASGGKNLRCIDALAALSGQVGIRGGGVTYTSRRSRGLDQSFLAKKSGRTIDIASYGRDLAALRDPPARFVYIHGANPVSALADSQATAAALRAVDFVVLADAFLTDTADCADLFLPVSLMLEDPTDAVGSFGHHHVARVRQAVLPPTGVREDVWIAQQLHRRLGLTPDPWLADPAAALERMVAPWFEASGDDFRRNPTQPEIPFQDGFATPSGQMRLSTEMPTAVEVDAAYPLSFLTAKPRSYQHSQIRPQEQRGLPLCLLSPEAPGAQGLQDGQPARVVSPLGSLSVRVGLRPGMRRDVCLLPMGGWLRCGRAPNALVAAKLTDMGFGTAFYDQRVRLES